MRPCYSHTSGWRCLRRGEAAELHIPTRKAAGVTVSAAHGAPVPGPQGVDTARNGHATPRDASPAWTRTRELEEQSTGLHGHVQLLLPSDQSGAWRA